MVASGKGRPRELRASVDLLRRSLGPPFPVLGTVPGRGGWVFFTIKLIKNVLKKNVLHHLSQRLSNVSQITKYNYLTYILTRNSWPLNGAGLSEKGRKFLRFASRNQFVFGKISPHELWSVSSWWYVFP